MSGNSVMGSENRAMSPSKVSMMDTTVDKTGLSINRLSITVGDWCGEAVTGEGYTPASHAPRK